MSTHHQNGHKAYDMPHDYLDVIDFWFRELTPQDWFGGGPALDDGITRRFADTLDQALNGKLDSWADTSRGRLALILVLDQFARHIHRGDAKSYAGAHKAEQLAKTGIEAGMDQKLPLSERHFFYIPLMHAEDKELQALSLEKFTELKRETERILGFASHHHDIVARFGRFPHRNAMLGRETTDEEETFLNSEENMFS